MIGASLRELVARRDLLYMLTWREVRIKYKQSVMGFLWAILMPAVIVGAGVLVRYAFSVMSNKPLVGDDLAVLSVKAIPWAFFVGCVRFSTSSLIGNANLVTKIYMPREIFPLASVLAQAVDFAVALVVLVVVLAALKVGLSLQILWFPLILLILFLQVIALSLILSAASLFFRDVKYIVEVVLTFAIFVVPVFYELSAFPKHATLLLLNPVTPILEALSATVVRHTPPDLPWLGYSAAIGLVGCVAAHHVFKRLEPYFAESI